MPKEVLKSKGNIRLVKESFEDDNGKRVEYFELVRSSGTYRTQDKDGVWITAIKETKLRFMDPDESKDIIEVLS